MKHLRIPLALVTIALAAVFISSATAATITFSGSYKGKVTERVNGQIVTAVTVGTGTGTLIGKGTLAGTVVATTAAESPCAPLKGPGTIKGAKGAFKLSILSGSRGCAASEDDKDNISFAGTAKVVGGTGKFIKARGSLRFTGRYDRTSGLFTLKLTGKVTY